MLNKIKILRCIFKLAIGNCIFWKFYTGFKTSDQNVSSLESKLRNNCENKKSKVWTLSSYYKE